MNSEKNARTPSKTGSKTITAERALAARLRELDIDPGALPSHVTAHLQAVAEEEAKRISDALGSRIAELESKCGEQLRCKIVRLVTFKTVGKAFALPATKPPGGAANESA